MAAATVSEISSPGFSFANCQRNAHLESKGYPVPKATKTGTTICGTVFKDGVILGADSRATSDNIVAEKECQKIYYLVPNMYTCGAGTAADMEKVAELISSQLELHRLNTGRSVPVVAACRMIKQRLFNYQGYIGAALIVGGVDSTGPHLFEIHPHGSSQTGMFCTMGSGSLACMSVLESRWKENMNLDEAKQMVRDAIKAGITNDLGSGSNVDMCVITKDKVDFIRPYEVVCAKGVREGKYDFKPGSTAVLSKVVRPVIIEEMIVRPVKPTGDDMDTTS